MASCEQRGLAYLFKLRQSQRVGDLLGKLAGQGNKAGWSPAGKGWEGVSQQIQLQGWSAARRVIVLRRKLAASNTAERAQQPLLCGMTLEHRKRPKKAALTQAGSMCFGCSYPHAGLCGYIDS